MSSYTAETTLAEAFIGNADIHSSDDTTRQQAWDSLTEAVKAVSPKIKGMQLLNRDAEFPRFSADFVVELSDYMMVSVRLSYDPEGQTVTLDSTLDASKDGHGLMSSDWENVADSCTHVFNEEEDTLGDLCDAILDEYCEIAYEALHRANRNMYPGNPSDELLAQLKAAI